MAAAAACDGLSLFKTKQCLKAITKPPTHAAEKRLWSWGTAASGVTSQRTASCSFYNTVKVTALHSHWKPGASHARSLQMKKAINVIGMGVMCKNHTDKLLLFIHLIPAVLSFKLRWIEVCVHVCVFTRSVFVCTQRPPACRFRRFQLLMRSCIFFAYQHNIRARANWNDVRLQCVSDIRVNVLSVMGADHHRQTH